MRLYLTGTVRSIGIGPRRPVHHQSIFCERASAPGTTLPGASSHLLNIILRRLVRCHLVGMDEVWSTTSPASTACLVSRSRQAICDLVNSSERRGTRARPHTFDRSDEGVPIRCRSGDVVGRSARPLMRARGRRRRRLSVLAWGLLANSHFRSWTVDRAARELFTRLLNRHRNPFASRAAAKAVAA